MKVSLMVAITVDGKIARAADHYPDWTGRADKRLYVEITKRAGVMIMGSKTFDAIGRVLPGRKNIVMTRDQHRQSQEPDLIFTRRTPGEIVNDLARQGFSSAALIGGSVVNTLFIKEGLVDEIHVTLVPRLFGQGLSLFAESLDIQMELLDVQKITWAHILLKYRVLP